MVIAQIFNPTAELVVPIEMLTIEAKAKAETYIVTIEAKISNISFHSSSFKYFFHHYCHTYQKQLKELILYQKWIIF